MLAIKATAILMAVVAIYISANILAAAWISRNLPKYARKTSRLLTNQLNALSTTRIWTTIFLHLLAALILYNAISKQNTIIWIFTVITIYIFFVSALTLSLLAQLPYIKALWEDTFFKISLLTIPIGLLYLAKGYASSWVDKLLGLSINSVPMTHFAATSLTLLAFVALALSLTALAFEFALIFTLNNNIAFEKLKFSKKLAILFSTKPIRNHAERQYAKHTAKRLGIVFLLLGSFIGCLSGFNAGLVLINDKFSKIVLSGIAFEFDAMKADRCDLTEEERALSNKEDPMLKAIFLSNNQEKAALVTRDENLWEAISLHTANKESSLPQKIKVKRIALCNS
ncbi:hypothetical protein [Acidovorax sp. BLS4]|uniref:hypothetical protein n=1 Tax=Acidovorax sp. BLS4 TaxID=3273430 RepID=UPI0029423E84|nr:hypothetical protein [Paracidovorax avenae]WOI45550.1 hypothetical protein R1Z03_24160 [Paracidovorax avenae]